MSENEQEKMKKLTDEFLKTAKNAHEVVPSKDGDEIDRTRINGQPKPADGDVREIDRGRPGHEPNSPGRSR